MSVSAHHDPNATDPFMLQCRDDLPMCSVSKERRRPGESLLKNLCIAAMAVTALLTTSGAGSAQDRRGPDPGEVAAGAVLGGILGGVESAELRRERRLERLRRERYFRLYGARSRSAQARDGSDQASNREAPVSATMVSGSAPARAAPASTALARAPAAAPASGRGPLRSSRPGGAALARDALASRQGEGRRQDGRASRPAGGAEPGGQPGEASQRRRPGPPDQGPQRWRTGSAGRCSRCIERPGGRPARPPAGTAWPRGRPEW